MKPEIKRAIDEIQSFILSLPTVNMPVPVDVERALRLLAQQETLSQIAVVRDEVYLIEDTPENRELLVRVEDESYNDLPSYPHAEKLEALIGDSEIVEGIIESSATYFFKE